MSKGFTLVELLVVMAVISLLMAITVPIMQSAMLRAHVGAMATDARAIHDGFKRHFIDNNMYPNAAGDSSFVLATFEPLVSMGYYDGRIASKLMDTQADGYDSPDDEGINQEFWIELTLGVDPSVRFLVADSNNAPLSGGAQMDGVYFYRHGVLTPLGKPILD